MIRIAVGNQSGAISLCGQLQKIMRRIEESNLHDIEKTSFSMFLATIRDAVKVEGPPISPGAEKLNEAREKLRMVQGTIKGGMPQVNKDRRVNNLVEMALALLAETENGEA